MRETKEHHDLRLVQSYVEKTMRINYWKEFSLNIKYQLKDQDIKEPIQVGYDVDNNLCFAILIPRFLLPIGDSECYNL